MTTHGEAADRSRRIRWYLVGALAALVLLLVAQGGVAYAYFSDTATAHGSAPVGDPVDLSVQAATGSTPMYPGTTGTVTFTVTNPNPFVVDVTALTGAAVAASSTTACPVTYVTVAVATPLAIPSFSVPARATSGLESLSGLVQLAADAPSACQGATFTVHLVLSAAAAS